MMFVGTTVYNHHGYMEIVDSAAQQSMQTAVEEVQGLPDYQSGGEVSSFTCIWKALRHLLLVQRSG